MAQRQHPGWAPARLRHLREQAGHTQESLADAIANLQVAGFRSPHPSPDVIGDHENGRHYPTAVYRRAYRHVLGGSEEHLGFRAAPPSATGGGVPSAQGETTRPDGQQGGGEATDRRGLIGWAATALGAPLAGMPALTSDDRLALLDRAASASGAVTAAEGILHTIVGDYLTLPPAVVLDRVAALQQLTDTVWAENPLRPADTTRLWKVAAIAAGIRGWLENNAGDTDAARSSLREAHRRADLIDDDQLIAWTRFMQAIIEDHAGDPTTAGRYGFDGLRHTAKRSPQRALLLGAVIAPVRAAKSDPDGTEKALAEAHDIVAALCTEQHGKDRGKTVVDAMATYSPAGFASDAGSAYAVLGRPDRFADVTADVRQAADSAETPHRVSFRMNEAAAVLRSVDPDPERAADLARGGLALASPFQTAYVSNRLGLILEAAQPFESHPAIRDLTEFSAAWRAARLGPSPR